MVSAIRYWLRAFGMIDDKNNLTNISIYIFDDTSGVDPYLEDDATILLLHYILISSNNASLYSEFFINFHKSSNRFNKIELHDYILKQFSSKKYNSMTYNKNTINKDIDVLIKNYCKPKRLQLHEDFTTLLNRLNLIIRDSNDSYNINKQPYINPIIFLFSLYDSSPNKHIIDFSAVRRLCLIFCISEDSAIDVLVSLDKMNTGLRYRNTAGEQLISIEKELNYSVILNKYYKP